jgi:hypothetical protein
MKKLTLIVATTLLSVSTLGSLSALAADSMGFGVVVDNLDVRKNTKLHVREYWKSIVNQSVSWSGEVYDVKASRSKVQVLVADKSRPLYKGYNIVVNTRDVSAAADLKIGQRVRFTGTLHEYKAEREGAVLQLAEAQLQGGESAVSRALPPPAPAARSRKREMAPVPDQGEPSQVTSQVTSQTPTQTPTRTRTKPAPPVAAQSPAPLPTQGFGETPAPAPAGPSAGLPTGE